MDKIYMDGVESWLFIYTGRTITHFERAGCKSNETHTPLCSKRWSASEYAEETDESLCDAFNDPVSFFYKISGCLLVSILNAGCVGPWRLFSGGVSSRADRYSV